GLADDDRPGGPPARPNPVLISWPVWRWRSRVASAPDAGRSQTRSSGSAHAAPLARPRGSASGRAGPGGSEITGSDLGRGCFGSACSGAVSARHRCRATTGESLKLTAETGLVLLAIGGGWLYPG